MKKKPTTPRSKLRSALRQAWLRSRERQAALKRDGYCCVACGVKQSKARGREVAVNVHHKDPINWTALLELIYQSGLMCGPDGLETLCVECHEKTECAGMPRKAFSTGRIQSHSRRGDFR